MLGRQPDGKSPTSNAPSPPGGENIVFSWVLWPSKTCDAAHENARTAHEGRMPMPFDGKRMIFGEDSKY
jgi:uncharacterized protein YbaA (DUF1428 family)